MFNIPSFYLKKKESLPQNVEETLILFYRYLTTLLLIPFDHEQFTYCSWSWD